MNQPSVDRAWELMERAYERGEMQVLGWADDSIMQPYEGTLTLEVQHDVRRSHEDEVILVAIRVPHPDEMSLDEVVSGTVLVEFAHGVQEQDA